MESISENTIAPMPYPQFQSLITTAANRYLAYIEMSNRRGSHTSRRVIQVLKIEPGHHQTEFFLTASEKFTASADWQVFVRQRPVEQIKILTVYKSRRGRPAAKVHVDFSYLDQFLALAPQDMEFIYDLSFLIARLRDFYRSGPFSFVPSAPQPLPELPEQYLDGLSVQQRRAVDGVSAAPVSYVMGELSLELPPGVGIDGDTIFEGKRDSIRVYGALTVYTSSYGRKFHAVCGCCGCVNQHNLYEVLDKMDPCSKCVLGRDIPDQVPEWYRSAKRLIRSRYNK